MRVFDKSNIPKPVMQVDLPTNFSNLDIEIGCGVGFHPIDYAKNNPERLLVAIEKTSEKFAKFLGRLEKHPQIKNVVPVHTNAIWWVAHYVKPQSVDRYFILYPNPYPKDPQKRFFEMPFMTYLVETLKPGGIITLATNEKYYFDESLENAQKIFGLKVIENRIVEKSEKPRTHFEKKYLERGETCYNLVLKK
ncbi:MAG: SAM-dependent methyltransferase [Bdellovibrionota bacterium]